MLLEGSSIFSDFLLLIFSNKHIIRKMTWSIEVKWKGLTSLEKQEKNYFIFC